jgi:RimJ/RimL family protein N-acetyltransferase
MQPQTTFNPILLDIPNEFQTERLLLRAPRPGDGALLHGSVLETLDELRRFPSSMPWALAEQSVASAEEYVRRGAAGWILRSEFPLLAFRLDTGEHVVNCGIHRFNWETRVFEIGWWCRRRFQGQGYASEAARGATEFAFRHLGARRVWCGADDANVRSWRVAERIGFAHEGTLVSERSDPDGTRRNMRVYAITR